MDSHVSAQSSLQLAAQRLKNLNPDQFELYFERRATTRIDSKDREIDTFSHAEDVGLAVRLIKDGRLGFSFTTSLEKGAIQKAVDTAFEVASHMPEDPYAALHSFSSSVYPNVDNLDTRGLKVPLSQKMALAKELEAFTREADPRITGVRAASISENTTEIYLVDSQGEQIRQESTLYTASTDCKAEANGDSQTGSEFGFSNYLDTLDVKSVAKQAADYAIERLGSQPAPTMQCPAVFRNSVVAELLDFLSASFSAENQDKGRSMLTGKIGQAIFSDHFTLIDDGLMDGGYGTSPFDGEGVPSRKTTLVDEGCLKGALYDSYYARKSGMEPTGSSVRGIKSPPSIGFSNLYLQKGEKSFKQLLDGILKGILITELMGIHTANPVTGDFSLGASGILIEKGKLTTPVRGFAVAGNLLDVFRKITDIGSDLRFFGSVGAPSIRTGEISIGGT